jgi:hypothetical protein
MSKSKILGLSIWTGLFVGTLSVYSCGGSKSEGSKTNPTQRSGRSLSKVEISLVDQAPSLSSDASKIVYLSGKGDTVLRVRKSSRIVGTAFATSERLTASSGLTTEQSAVISPDGNYVLLQGQIATAQALVLCNFAGTSCTQVTSTPYGSANFYFSPDSSGFYFLSGSNSSGASLYVAASTSPTSAYKIGGDDVWQKAAWLPQASGFRIAAIDYTAATGKSSLKTYTFATLPVATSAVSTTVLSELSSLNDIGRGPLGGSAGTTAALSLLMTVAVKASTSLVFSEIGNVSVSAEMKDRQIPVTKQNVLYNLSTGTATNVTPAGIQASESLLLSDGNTVLSLQMVAGRCDAETSATFGSVLTSTNASTGVSTYVHLKKPIDLSQAPVAAASFCDRAVDSTVTGAELSIYDLAVNSAASESAYTAAWTSDMTGDPEVFVMDKTAAGTTLWNISANRKN